MTLKPFQIKADGTMFEDDKASAGDDSIYEVKTDGTPQPVRDDNYVPPQVDWSMPMRPIEPDDCGENIGRPVVLYAIAGYFFAIAAGSVALALWLRLSRGETHTGVLTFLLGIPIGIGLLRRMDFWRVIAAALLFMLTFFMVFDLLQNYLAMSDEDGPSFIMWFVELLWMVLNAAALRLLTYKEIRELFKPSGMIFFDKTPQRFRHIADVDLPIWLKTRPVVMLNITAGAMLFFGFSLYFANGYLTGLIIMSLLSLGLVLRVELVRRTLIPLLGFLGVLMPLGLIIQLAFNIGGIFLGGSGFAFGSWFLDWLYVIIILYCYCSLKDGDIIALFDKPRPDDEVKEKPLFK